jgi:hypothetical protein
VDTVAAGVGYAASVASVVEGANTSDRDTGSRELKLAFYVVAIPLLVEGVVYTASAVYGYRTAAACSRQQAADAFAAR